jgi:hypothetical protein
MNPFKGIEIILWFGLAFIVLLVLGSPFILWWIFNHVSISIR